MPCPAPVTANWEGWGRSRSRGGWEDTVGTTTMPAAPPAAPWDRHDTVGLGTGEGTLTRPDPGRPVQPQEPCVNAAPGLLQPAELSSDAHTHTSAHTHTCTHAHTHPPTHAELYTLRGMFAHIRSVPMCTQRPCTPTRLCTPTRKALHTLVHAIPVHPAHTHEICLHTQSLRTPTHACSRAQSCARGCPHRASAHQYTCTPAHKALHTQQHACTCAHRTCAPQHTHAHTQVEPCTQTRSYIQSLYQCTCAHVHQTDLHTQSLHPPAPSHT